MSLLPRVEKDFWEGTQTVLNVKKKYTISKFRIHPQ